MGEKNVESRKWDSEKLDVDVQVHDRMDSPRLFVICGEAAEKEQY